MLDSHSISTEISLDKDRFNIILDRMLAAIPDGGRRDKFMSHLDGMSINPENPHETRLDVLEDRVSKMNEKNGNQFDIHFRRISDLMDEPGDDGNDDKIEKFNWYMEDMTLVIDRDRENTMESLEASQELQAERRDMIIRHIERFSDSKDRNSKKKLDALLEALSIRKDDKQGYNFDQFENRIHLHADDEAKLRINRNLDKIMDDEENGRENILQLNENLEHISRRLNASSEKQMATDNRVEPPMSRQNADSAEFSEIPAYKVGGQDGSSSVVPVDPATGTESGGSVKRVDEEEFRREAEEHYAHNPVPAKIGNPDDEQELGGRVERMDSDEFMREAKAHKELEENAEAETEEIKDPSDWMIKPEIWPPFIDFPSHNDRETLRIAEKEGLLDDEMKAKFNAKYQEMSVRFQARAKLVDAWIFEQNKNFTDERKHFFLLKSYIKRDIDNLRAQRKAHEKEQDLLPEDKRNYDNPDPFYDIKWASLLNPDSSIQIQNVARWGHSTLVTLDGGILKADNDSMYVPFGDAGSADAGKMAVMEAVERGWSTINISGSPEFVQAARQKAVECGIGAKITIHTGLVGKTRTEFLMPRLPAEEGMKSPVEEAKDAHDELSGNEGKAPKNGPDQPMIGRNEEQPINRDHSQPATSDVDYSALSDGEHSETSDIDYSGTSDVDHSSPSDVDYSALSDIDHSGTSDVESPVNRDTRPNLAAVAANVNASLAANGHDSGQGSTWAREEPRIVNPFTSENRDYGHGQEHGQYDYGLEHSDYHAPPPDHSGSCGYDQVPVNYVPEHYVPTDSDYDKTLPDADKIFAPKNANSNVGITHDQNHDRKENDSEQYHEDAMSASP